MTTWAGLIPTVSPRSISLSHASVPETLREASSSRLVTSSGDLSIASHSPVLNSSRVVATDAAYPHGPAGSGP